MLVLATFLTAGNVQQSHANAASALERSGAPAPFELYTLQRSTGLDAQGEKTPDVIWGENVTTDGGSEPTEIARAARIQEFAGPPTPSPPSPSTTTKPAPWS
ncbi:hypothetical protein [Arthrobacter sp. ISL-72]|uniref:hypothetical protein n=1 Tax=Arthrobacter sp. ISL-72 TaxID=2819114 RepID=UPI001BE4FC05|nr:hypothetical protein [Arthrobacter sp. ISL-72]MBT2594014.1 hypothetical protein [Arthrobacter sp. ISL-72]